MDPRLPRNHMPTREISRGSEAFGPPESRVAGTRAWGPKLARASRRPENHPIGRLKSQQAETCERFARVRARKAGDDRDAFRRRTVEQSGLSIEQPWLSIAAPSAASLSLPLPRKLCRITKLDRHAPRRPAGATLATSAAVRTGASGGRNCVLIPPSTAITTDGI